MSTNDAQHTSRSDSTDNVNTTDVPDALDSLDPSAGVPMLNDEDTESEQPSGFDTESINLPRDDGLYKRSLANAIAAAHCADEMRAKDVVVLDMTKIASIVDFFVIATGTSRRQMHAVADEVNRRLKGEHGNARLGVEGYRTEGNWILMDFGDVVLHIFTDEGRELYDLENLKADAERVDWKSLSEPT